MELLGLPMDAIPFIPLRVNVTPEVTRYVQNSIPYLCLFTVLVCPGSPRCLTGTSTVPVPVRYSTQMSVFGTGKTPGGAGTGTGNLNLKRVKLSGGAQRNSGVTTCVLVGLDGWMDG